MIREIQFRAWDTVQEKMLPVETINFREDLITLDEGDNSVSDSNEMFILMQYTGLKDRNGKEIYEGDIVKVKIQGGYSDHYCDNEHTKTVIYNNEAACWKPFDRCRMWRDGSNLTAVEVIGSVYDNPDLLEGGYE
ncbi:hypothetical protein J28TS4_04890 [Paenibacillus lautus]|uniref:YopX family protein n=1 Tax=Paenibacillus lautus TaxID=1401 RepID=UPI001B0B1884|nr:YopX family protein [Paenibacillus lautus]GIP02082.1 hypothetical protein J28TS4_04890 [Paenibacillus lautus]